MTVSNPVPSHERITLFRDTGCALSPRCLECPLDTCYDGSYVDAAENIKRLILSRFQARVAARQVRMVARVCKLTEDATAKALREIERNWMKVRK